jgi:hypothetical protein
MNRTRRVTATVVAAAGLLGAAGVAAASVSGLTGDKSSKIDASPSTAAASGRHAQTAGERADALARTTLEDYIAGMSQRANRLGERVTAAEARLIAARTVRARLIAQVRARVAADDATPTTRNQPSSAPVTHASTGASSAGHGEDDDDDDHHGRDGGDDGGGDDD